jgi:signal transduction histidine kinase
LTRSHYLRLTWPVGLLGVLASVVTGFLLCRSESLVARAGFRADAAERAVAIRGAIDESLAAVHALAGYWKGVSDVDPVGFRRFASALIEHQPAIQALEWVPRVPHARRSEFEREARREGFAGFEIRERQRQGSMVAAGRRDEYFPVRYVEPLEGNEAALGFDLGSVPNRSRVLERARDENALKLTGRVMLVQETESNFGLLALRPIFDGEAGGDALTGFVLAVFRVEDMLAAAVDEPSLRPIALELRDLDAEPGEGLLYATADSGTSSGDLPVHTAGLEFGGRRWSLRLTPGDGYVLGWRLWVPVAGVGAVLAATTLGVGLLLLTAGSLRRRQLEELSLQVALTEERERRRIAVGLHDDIGQTLALARIRLGELARTSPSQERAASLREVRGLIDPALAAARSLAFDLSSPVLYELGLEPALHDLTERLERHSGVRFRFEADDRPKPLSEDASVVLFRVVRELAHNVVRHAEASSAAIKIERQDGQLHIAIEDDGVGFVPAEVNGHHMGLSNVRQQLQQIGARLSIRSSPGAGCRAGISLPVGE